VVGAVLAAALVLWQSGAAADLIALLTRGEGSEAGQGLDAQPMLDLEQELERRLVLRGLPGVEEEAAQGRGVVTGSVKLFVTGQPARPLPGVDVLLVTSQTRRGAGPNLRATTDADGGFLFETVPAPASYALVVRHAPYRDVVRMGVAVAHGRTLDLGEILLGAPTQLTGEVVDSSGRPVPGARVQVFADASRPDAIDLVRALAEVQSAMDSIQEATSDAGGAFVVKSLSPGRYVLRVSAPGYASTFRGDVRVTVDERSGGVRVVLDPGAGWYGTVTDVEGRPVSGARLVAIAMMGEAAPRVDRVDAVSASDGAYRLDTLVAGVRYYVEAWAEGRGPSVSIGIAEGVVRRDVRLSPAGRVEGRVTDKATGQPVEGVQVSLLGKEFTLVSALTDASGFYALPAVTAGPLLLFTAKAIGFEPLGLGGDALPKQGVVAGQTTVIDAVLSRGGTFSGRLLGPEGRPVAYATVALAIPGRRFEGEVAAVTEANGSFRLEGLKEGTHEVRITAPGYAPLVAEADSKVVIPPDFAPVVRDLRLPGGGAFEGRVLAPDGTPVAGALVEARAVLASLRGRVRDLVAFSDSAGGWRMPGVPPGIDLSLSARHDAWARVEVVPVRLSEGQRQVRDLTLRPGAALPARVEDEQGRPVADARVRWGHVGPENEEHLQRGDSYRADGALGTRVIHSDREGRFRLERLEAGRLLLRVEREGFADWYRSDLTIPTEGDASELVVTLRGALQVRGRVTAADDGRPLAGVWVYAEENKPGAEAPQDPGRVRALVATQTAADGSYVLDRLPPQPCRVAVWLALGFKGESRPDVVPGRGSVDFALQALPPPGTK
jgi:protocatechuate 3,4-dioxygenase beta subunit